MLGSFRINISLSIMVGRLIRRHKLSGRALDTIIYRNVLTTCRHHCPSVGFHVDRSGGASSVLIRMRGAIISAIASRSDRVDVHGLHSLNGRTSMSRVI